MSKILELIELIKGGDVANAKSFLKINRDLDINTTVTRSDSNRNKKTYCRKRHTSPLQALCRGSWNEEIFQLLLSAGVDVNWAGSGYPKYSPLLLAIRPGNLDAVTSLVKHGADVNQKGDLEKSPLTRAASIQELEITKWLLDNGADIYEFHSENCALAAACSTGNVELVGYLFEKMSQASEEQKNARYQDTCDHSVFNYLYRYCLRLAMEGNSDGHMQCADLLIQSECIELGAADSATATMLTYTDPLIFAIKRLNIPVVKLLLRANCDVNTPRRLYGRPPCSPVHLALELYSRYDPSFRAVKVTELLVQAGCSVEIDMSKYENIGIDSILPEHINNISDVIASNHWSRLPLKRLCRIAVRKQIGSVQFQKKVQKLLLPKSLKDFVLMKDILGDWLTLPHSQKRKMLIPNL